MHVLITGGAGFIGCHLANAMIAHGHQVTLYGTHDTPGSRINLAWLRDIHHDAFACVDGDIRDEPRLTSYVHRADVVFHLAGQNAVATSIRCPRADFEINATGTLNVLEAARTASHQPIVVYASTSKVYGANKLVTQESNGRYHYRDMPAGIPEDFELDCETPYACSKGSGEQYMRAYARTYGLRTVVFRQSNIYGPRQFNIVHQGWLSAFVLSAQRQRPVLIYGDGKQVRDMLYVDDLVRAYQLAIARISVTQGRIYNIGGGQANALAVWKDTEPLLRQLAGRPIAADFREWRSGDQRVGIMDISRAKDEFGWEPQIGIQEGIGHLWQWMQEHRELFQHVP